jgi:hypothetical protein
VPSFRASFIRKMGLKNSKAIKNEGQNDFNTYDYGKIEFKKILFLKILRLRMVCWRYVFEYC